MSRLAGRSGRLYVGLATSAAAAEPVTFLRQWSIDFTTDDIEVTAFGDSNKVYVAGLPDASGAFSGFYDDATAQLYTAATDGAARRFYLYPTTADVLEYFWGTATFDFSVEAAVDGAVTVAGSWKAATAVSKQAT